MSVFDDYFKTIQPNQRKELERIYEIITKTVPELEETISYGMPTFKYKGKYLVGMSAFKNHLSLFPGSEAIEDLKAELGSHAAAKGTIKFTIDDPLSEELVVKVVQHGQQRIDSK